MTDGRKNNKGADKHWLWKPGQSGNKSGRPKGMITRDQVSALMGRFWSMSLADIEAVIADSKSSAGERMVASIVKRAIADGDPSRAAWLLSRSVGKVKDELEVSTPRPFIAQYRDGTAEIMGVEEPRALPEGEEK